MGSNPGYVPKSYLGSPEFYKVTCEITGVWYEHFYETWKSRVIIKNLPHNFLSAKVEVFWEGHENLKKSPSL